jgi:hypothetical protein
VSIHNALKLPIRDLCLVRENVVRGCDVTFPGDLAPGARIEVPLPPAGKIWQRLGAHAVLPDPFDQNGGLFARQGGAGPFVPADDTDRANAEARERMARAAMGAALAGLFRQGATASTRILARQGLDLSAGVSDGRILVMGWCDGDPLGGLPTSRNVRSSVVVVRRLLPAEEGK